MKTVYICNDTITGIFSAVYDAWRDRQREETCKIAFKNTFEQELFCEYRQVEETEHKAQVVENLIKKHLGRRAYWDLYHAVLSQDEEKGDAVLGTMLAAREIPDSTKIMEHLSHPKVAMAFRLGRNVEGEAHSYKGFLRFRELASGVLYSEITPKNQVLTCLAPHFADRLPLENWMIYDKTHQMFVVHEKAKKWVLVWNEDIDLSAASRVSDKEMEYARLWKSFVRTIAIESRTNPKCQLNHLPLHFRGDMLEMG